jgi:hypothetical protein
VRELHHLEPERARSEGAGREHHERLHDVAAVRSVECSSRIHCD